LHRGPLPNKADKNLPSGSKDIHRLFIPKAATPLGRFCPAANNQLDFHGYIAVFM
jgi:hypothetical protein